MATAAGAGAGSSSVMVSAMLMSVPPDRAGNSAPANAPRRAPASLSFAGLELAERYVLVDADVARQPQHPLGDDVAQDLVGAARDAQARRIEQRLLEPAIHRRELRIHDGARHAHQIDAVGGDVLQLAREIGRASCRE